MPNPDPTPEKLTACKDCKHEKLEGEEYVCLASPFKDWDAHQGRETIRHYKGCARVNTDGHCPHFEAKK